MNKRSACALLLNCKPEQLLGFSDPIGGASCVAPDGRKYFFPNHTLESALATAALKQETGRCLLSPPVETQNLASPPKPKTKPKTKTPHPKGGR